MAKWKGIVGTGFTPDAFEEYASSIAFGAWRPSFVVVHNTQDPRFARWHSVPGPRRMLGFQSYYRDDQKWSGGPHLFVADDQIWVFTPLTVPGVHSPSWNSMSWGVEIVGDYDHEPFSDAVRDNVVHALASLHAAAGLDPSTIKLHKEDPRTTHSFCPGTNVDKAELIARVQDLLAERFGGEHSADRRAAPTAAAAASPRRAKPPAKKPAPTKRNAKKRDANKAAAKRRRR